MEIPFVKLHGNGNDFVLIDEYAQTIIPDDLKGQFAALYCERRFGIGADGILFLAKPTRKADIRMRILHPDESEAEMCGNGIRCLAKYAYDMGYIQETCTVQTEAGDLEVSVRYEGEECTVTIGMGEPKFKRKDIPATGKGEYHEQIGGFEVHAVNTGVPHAVILTDDLGSIDLAAVAPQIRNHPTFPHGANVNFVQKTGEDSIRVRTFERGVEDETLSCGTGATASAAVVHHLGYMNGPVQVETKGGPLTIHFDPEGKARMEGPAVAVFSGLILY